MNFDGYEIKIGDKIHIRGICLEGSEVVNKARIGEFVSVYADPDLGDVPRFILEDGVPILGYQCFGTELAKG